MHRLLALGVGAAAQSSYEVIVGDVRVQALSPTLVRVEPRGPMGFEDRTTFMVSEDRSAFKGVPLTQQESSAGTLLTTDYYSVLLRPALPKPSVAAPLNSTDVMNSVKAQNFPNGAIVQSRDECSALCESDPTCVAWVHAISAKRLTKFEIAMDKILEDLHIEDNANCWPIQAFDGLVAHSGGREFGCSSRGTVGVGGMCSAVPPFSVLSPAGDVLYDLGADLNTKPNMLNWPAPLTSGAYALADFPRFFVPAWGVAPIPDGTSVDPALVPTHGYDFRNNVPGDTYVFLLGSDLKGWEASRREFLKLTGPTPLLPDFAYGTWFTYWHPWTEEEAKADVTRWETDDLPIDVWGLDMNWRFTDNHEDRFYNYPNTQLFPNFTEWFEWMRSKGLRTYFNDHPFPVSQRDAGGMQTSPEETAFRWQGLTEWLANGLTYWWFDHNWYISIPPPFVNASDGTLTWNGLDNAAWGSHVYYSIIEAYDRRVRDKAGDKWYGRPLLLSKFGVPDANDATMSPFSYAEHPSQHRFPVWWTGDFVPILSSIRTMVNSGMHGLKPFVHSDCGGDYEDDFPNAAGDLLRYTQHCAFGSIHRFHGAAHEPWVAGAATEPVLRNYLKARYRLMPTIIGAGAKAGSTGHPPVARGDFFWPEHAPSSALDNQYIFLDDLLVAPIWDSTYNVTTRTAWVPPGEWQDAWDGSVITGPKTILATQPYERLPLWIRRDGGLLVLYTGDALRVDDQDWSTLTLELFPSKDAVETSRTIAEKGTDATQETTNIVLSTDGKGHAQVDIKPSNDADRAWLLRFNLKSGERLIRAQVDGESVPVSSITEIAPVDEADALSFFPLRGAGGSAPRAGPVFELQLAAKSGARSVQVLLEQAKPILAVV